MNDQKNSGAIRKRPAGEHSPERPNFGERLLRALPIVGLLLILTWAFGHSGMLHKLETTVSDAEMRLNRPPIDSAVAIVNINDEDYRDLFESTSPLDPARLQRLIAHIAMGEPSVIGVDIDTSSARFATQFKLENWSPRIVWERELQNVPENVSGHESLEPLPILGGQKYLDPARNSTGLALLIDDAEDKVTRRYRRVIETQEGMLPSFPWAITEAYLQDRPVDSAQLQASSDDLLIRYSGTREGSHRLKLSATKLEELSKNWPTASPIRGKIVLLGGSYLGQDRHDTPIGQLTGLAVMANVIETELSGGGYKAPGRATLFLLELFEAFVLILLFHILRLRWALVWSLVLIPLMAVVCSTFAYGDKHHFIQFALVLLGLLVFELYEHFRRTAIPRVYHDLTHSS